MAVPVLLNKTYKELSRTSNTSFSDDVVKALSPEDENEPSEKQKKATLDQHNNIVAQYKELIREQVCNSIIYSAMKLIVFIFYSDGEGYRMYVKFFLFYLLLCTFCDLIFDASVFNFRMHS